MKTAVVIALAVGVSACSMLPVSVSQIEESVAQAAVQSSERTICRNIPVGTWLRLYASSPERLAGWQALCYNQVAAP